MRTHTHCLIFTALALATGAPAQGGRPVGYTVFERNGHTFHAVTVDMASGRYAAVCDYSARLTNPWRKLSRHQPVAAITGTFFAWENQQPVADVVVNGRLKAEGDRGTVLAVDWFGRVRIFDAGFREPVDWFPYRHALRGTVRVVRGGDVCPDPRAQRFRDPAIWGRAARTGVGLTEGGKLVLIASRSSLTLSELGRAMVQTGVVDGVSLDGGGSTMLYFGGRMVVPTGRPLSTLFMVVPRGPYDDEYGDHLARVAGNQARGAASRVAGWAARHSASR